MYHVLPLDYDGKIPYKLLNIQFTAFANERYGGIGDYDILITDQKENLLYSYTTLTGINGCSSRIKGLPLYTNSNIGTFIYELLTDDDDMEKISPSINDNYVQIVNASGGDFFFQGVYRLKLDLNSVQ
jgi:hypothetical protein